MALNVDELRHLLGILRNDETHTFESLLSLFQQRFAREGFLRVGNALVTFLVEPDLLPRSTQRLVVLFLLCEMFKPDQSPSSGTQLQSVSSLALNPFLGVFHRLLHPNIQDWIAKHQTGWGLLPILTKRERTFLTFLLCSGPKEILKKTPKQVVQAEHFNAPAVDIVSAIEAAVKEQSKLLPAGAQLAVSSLIPLPDKFNAYEEASAYKLSCEELFCGGESDRRAGRGGEAFSFRPEFLRLAPPLHPVADDELYWTQPFEPRSLLPIRTLTTEEDVEEAAPAPLDDELKQLMQRAFTTALTQEQQKRIVAELGSSGTKLAEFGLTPTTLPELVEQNPLVAIELLLQLMSGGSGGAQITDYFSALVGMPMSLHSMEVVNRLTTAVDLPQEFLQLYISNCISTCESIKDRYMQKRLVRLLCVFLQSLIRNKTINIQDLFIEIQAFCIEFSGIREAAGLFRLLKQLDGGVLGDEFGGGDSPTPPGEGTRV